LGTQVTYTVAEMAGAVNYIWEIPTGATVVSGQGTNSLTLTFSSAMATSTSLYVSYSNSCGTVSNRRKLTITEVPCLGRPANTVEYSELYPNPSSSNFNIDINAAAASELTVVVYAFNGNVVSEEKHNLQRGNNTVTTNTSRLPKGLYVVRFINPTTNSVETKKFFKN
jgi:archaellum component FlaF (FlaF/FlaG flagellin family)